MSVNLEIVKNSDFEKTFTVYNPLGTVQVLTGYSIESEIKRNPTSSEYITFVVAITDAVHGKAKLSLPHSITNTMSGNYMYDIFLIDPDLKRYKIEDGLITIKLNITR